MTTTRDLIGLSIICFSVLVFIAGAVYSWHVADERDARMAAQGVVRVSHGCYAPMGTRDR